MQLDCSAFVGFAGLKPPSLFGNIKLTCILYFAFSSHPCLLFEQSPQCVQRRVNVFSNESARSRLHGRFLPLLAQPFELAGEVLKKFASPPHNPSGFFHRHQPIQNKIQQLIREEGKWSVHFVLSSEMRIFNVLQINLQVLNETQSIGKEGTGWCLSFELHRRHK